MNIFEIIKENLPEGVEITDKAIKAIEKEIKAEQGREFIPKEQYSRKTEKLDELEKELKDLQGKSADAEAYKAKYDAEVKAHADTKSAIETEKTLNAKRTAAKAEFIKKGVNEKVFDDFMGDKLDYDKLELDGDKIKNADEYVKGYQERYGDYFGKTQTKGTDTPTPPAGQDKTTVTNTMNDFIRSTKIN